MPTISGTVKDASGAGVARLVRAYRQDTGVLQATTTSNAAGVFSMAVSSSLPHRVVCEDAVLDTSCVLLMHFDGANGGIVFTEETGKTATRANAVTSTEVSKFGGASGYFNGTNAYVSVPSSADLLFGASDFCIEFDFAWKAVQTLPAGTYRGLVSKYDNLTNNRSYSIDLCSSDGGLVQVAALYSSNGTSFNRITSGFSPVVGQLVHVEFSRAAGFLYLFCDGLLQGTVSIGSEALYANATTPLVVGGRSGLNGPTNAYIDELRIRKAVGHTANYVDDLPSEPYSLLTSYGGNALVFDGVVPV